ncbi:MAG: hypothetical protein CVV51_06165 [Spirochaetae bacterium HGW-Spirochaetae-7]|jgi:hypothetical protein|nr:MAG: hypothetical protein CVV51_06165 [Spirochaetae bacterium HGW-Spirochaetae-7]
MVVSSKAGLGGGEGLGTGFTGAEEFSVDVVVEEYEGLLPCRLARDATERRSRTTMQIAQRKGLLPESATAFMPGDPLSAVTGECGTAE